MLANIFARAASEPGVGASVGALPGTAVMSSVRVVAPVMPGQYGSASARQCVVPSVMKKKRWPFNWPPARSGLQTGPGVPEHGEAVPGGAKQ